MLLRSTIGSLLAIALLAPKTTADVLPVEAIGEDTVAVLWLDTAKLDGKSLAATAAALIGDAAKDLLEPLGDLEKTRDAYTKVGGRNLAIVFRGPDANGRPPEPYFLIPLAAGTNPDDAIAAIKKATGNVPISKHTDRTLIVVPERWKPAVAEANDTHKAFEKVFAGATDSPATLVFIPNDAMRQITAKEKPNLEQAEQFMPGMTSVFLLGEQACAMKQIVATTKLGADASVTFIADAADESGAKLLAERMKEAGEGFAKMKAAFAAAPGGGPEEAVKMFTLMNTLMTKVPVKVAGTQVTAVLQGEQLKETASVIAAQMKLARERAKRFLLANRMRQLALAIIQYDAENNKLPDKLEDLEKYVDGKDGLAKLLEHPITGDKIGISYVKPAKSLANVQRPNITAILFEMKDGKINASGWTGYADGHVQQGQPAADPAEGFKEEEKR